MSLEALVPFNLRVEVLLSNNLFYSPWQITQGTSYALYYIL